MALCGWTFRESDTAPNGLGSLAQASVGVTQVNVFCPVAVGAGETSGRGVILCGVVEFRILCRPFSISNPRERVFFIERTFMLPCEGERRRETYPQAKA